MSSWRQLGMREIAGARRNRHHRSDSAAIQRARPDRGKPSGDSDSTAAIAGNILGALYGEETAMELGVDGVELREEIVRLAADLLDAWMDGPRWRERYPAGPVRDSS